MLTLKLISEETERVIKGLEKKHFAGAREAIEKVLEYDKLRRESQQKLDSNKQHQNQLSKQIGGLMKEGKKDEAEKVKAEVAELKAADKALQEIMDKAQTDMTNELLQIPNIPNELVPEAKARMPTTMLSSRRVVRCQILVTTHCATGICSRNTIS